MSIATKNTIGALLIAVAMFLFWAFDVVSYQQIPQYRQLIEERQKVLTDRTAILDSLDQAYKEYQNRKADIQILSYAVPTKRQTENLIVAIDAIAVQSGVRLQDISISPAKTANAAITDVGIDLVLSGSYAGLQLFLSLLEQNTRIIDVNQISLANESGILSVNLRAKTYFVQ